MPSCDPGLFQEAVEYSTIGLLDRLLVGEVNFLSTALLF